MRYWISIDKKNLGPFTPEEIRRQSAITDDAMVFPDGATAASDWRRLRDVPELVRAVRGPAAPLPALARVATLIFSAVMICMASGCASLLYLDEGNPDKDYKNCSSSDTYPCRFVLSHKSIASESSYLSVRRETIVSKFTDNAPVSWSGHLWLLFESTPLGFIAPVFGYPPKRGGYGATVTLQISPLEAAQKTGMTHEFHVVPGQSEEWLLDFDEGAREKLKETGRVTAYKPHKVKITVACDKHTCSVSADPPVIGQDGTLSLEVHKLEDKKRLKEIPDEERRKQKEIADQEQKVKALIQHEDLDALGALGPADDSAVPALSEWLDVLKSGDARGDFGRIEISLEKIGTPRALAVLRRAEDAGVGGRSRTEGPYVPPQEDKKLLEEIDDEVKSGQEEERRKREKIGVQQRQEMLRVTAAVAPALFKAIADCAAGESKMAMYARLYAISPTQELLGQHQKAVSDALEPCQRFASSLNGPINNYMNAYGNDDALWDYCYKMYGAQTCISFRNFIVTHR